MNEIKTKKFEIADFKVSVEDEGTYITGYANTKGKPDSYGDIPYNLKGKPVYDLKRFKSNPVMLADHTNSVGNIVGNFVKIDEDDKGLYFKAKLMDNPQTDIAKHAIEALRQGYARAFSIGGIWLYEDSKNPKHLTTAIIHEISVVGVGADGNALSEVPKVKKVDTENDVNQETVEKLSKRYGADKVNKILTKIKEIKDNGRND
jgi:HK97 family phage prohead protease